MRVSEMKAWLRKHSEISLPKMLFEMSPRKEAAFSLVCILSFLILPLVSVIFSRVLPGTDHWIANGVVAVIILPWPVQALFSRKLGRVFDATLFMFAFTMLNLMLGTIPEGIHHFDAYAWVVLVLFPCATAVALVRLFLGLRQALTGTTC